MASQFSPPLCCRFFTIAKDGQPSEKCEDIVAGDPESGRFALCDGATESLLTQLWGKLLVEQHLERPFEPDHETWEEWLTPLRKQWWEEAQGTDLPWWAEHKLEAGASSTFIGLVLTPDGKWTAYSVGDSCIFHLETHGSGWTSAPLTRVEDFDSNPPLVGSRPRDSDAVPAHHPGEWKSRDRFVLMSDAIACWFLEKLLSEPGDHLHKLLTEWLTSEDATSEFADFVQATSDNNNMKRDDVSVIIIDVP